tara:strand:+ start:57 stop:554 length:498 start_codon:yes stop_codon:yes gene_type:complete
MKKIRKNKVEKILIDIIKAHHKKELRDKQIKIVVENDCIHTVELKEFTHNDSNKYDMQLVGDYDAEFFYKGTKTKVEKSELDKWFSEHKWVSKETFDSRLDKHEWFSFFENEDGTHITVSGNGNMLLDDSEFYSSSLEKTFNDKFKKAGLMCEPYSSGHFVVVKL